jgi:hypothetical protein
MMAEAAVVLSELHMANRGKLIAPADGSKKAETCWSGSGKPNSSGEDRRLVGVKQKSRFIGRGQEDKKQESN